MRSMRSKTTLVLLITGLLTFVGAVGWYSSLDQQTVHPATLTPAAGTKPERRLPEPEPAGVRPADFGWNETLAKLAAMNGERLSAPEVAAMAKRQSQRQVQRRYGWLFGRLEDLGPERLQALKQLMVEREATRSDAREASVLTGIAPRSHSATQAVSAATAEYEQRIEALLGDRYADFKTAETLAGPLEQIRMGIGPELEYQGDPLSPSQLEQLAAAMRDAESSATGEQTPRPGAELWPAEEAVLRRAQTFLSPAQIDRLRVRFRENATLRRAMNR